MRVLIAEGDPRSALPKLRLAGSAWRELDAPYETARVRVLVGQACRALADFETSAMEFDGARAGFERLEARPDLERLDKLAASPSTRVLNGLTRRELEVLSLVASGVTNRAIARQLGLSEKTVARHVSNIFTKIAVTSRAAATSVCLRERLDREFVDRTTHAAMAGATQYDRSRETSAAPTVLSGRSAGTLMAKDHDMTDVHQQATPVAPHTASVERMGRDRGSL